MSRTNQSSMVARLRAIRDELGKEWQDLSWDERLRALDERTAEDPVWQRWVCGHCTGNQTTAQDRPTR
jgi:hypothetical protein